jgi:pyrimidine deaminase RibD-like protein
MKKLSQYILQAVKEAEKSICNKQLGAVCISRGRICSKAFNRHQTARETSRKGEGTFHAEEIALNRTGNNQVDTLIVVRISQSNGLGMSMPCKRCMAKIKRLQVKEVIYSDWMGSIQKLNLR